MSFWHISWYRRAEKSLGNAFATIKIEKQTNCDYKRKITFYG